MQTTDNVIHIHHEADWSSKALISWRENRGNDPRETAVDAPLLWGDNPNDIHLCLPPDVAIRAVRLATRGRARWEHDQVLSRPVPGRALLPWTERGATAKRHTGRWAVVKLLAGSSGNGWTVYPSLAVSRWESQEHAHQYARDRRKDGMVWTAVLDWGDDLKHENLFENARVRAALEAQGIVFQDSGQP